MNPTNGLEFQRVSSSVSSNLLVKIGKVAGMLGLGGEGWKL